MAMQTVVSDTSCMIDLRKGGLLEAMLQLPYSFVMPDTLFENEWLGLSADEKRALLNLGLEVRTLPGHLVQRAARYFNQHARLALNDCFALVLAEQIEDCILLTGDGLLRRIAEEKSIEVHGVLWAIDEMESQGSVPVEVLHNALQLFLEDELVFLPTQETRQRIRRLSRRL